MTLPLPTVQSRSRKPREAPEFARDQNCFEAMHGALFRAFFEVVSGAQPYEYVRAAVGWALRGDGSGEP